VLQHHLEEAAERWPDKVALIAGDRQLTYAELDAASNQLARGLIAAGLGRGDRIAIYLDNRAETVIAIYGVLKSGAAFMMVNPTTKVQKLVYLLRNSRARALVMARASLDQMLEHLEGTTLETVITVGDGQLEAVDGLAVLPWQSVVEGQGPGVVDAGGIDLDLAGLLYTSGSTGEAKGVMLTHLNITSAVDSIVRYLRLSHEDVTLNVLPLSFGYGLTQLFPAVRVGARLILEKGMVFPHVTLTQMATHGATGFAMVPTIATMLLGMDLSRYDLSRLRYLTNAGAGIPPELARRLRVALPHVQLFLMYGQTECLRVLYLEPDQVDTRTDSVGRGMPNQELFIVTDEGQPAAANEVGELVVRGAHVMAGYWDRPDETAQKLRPGLLPGERVLFTGDLFRRDEHGYFYFVSRRDDIIKCRGEKVSPREVENVIYTLSGVLEACVVGVPDPLLGQAVKAVVVLRPGVALEPRDIQRHCALNLEDYMVPSQVEFREELPKNERGKIMRRELVTLPE
jgi:amino acid adenylation domain-containing protein